jgi:hypothetical protein
MRVTNVVNLIMLIAVALSWGYPEGVREDGEDWFDQYLDSRDDQEEERNALDLSVDDAGMF